MKNEVPTTANSAYEMIRMDQKYLPEQILCTEEREIRSRRKNKELIRLERL
jgi:hypothetical protein